MAQTEASIFGLESKGEYSQEVEKQIQMIAKGWDHREVTALHSQLSLLRAQKHIFYLSFLFFYALLEHC